MIDDPGPASDWRRKAVHAGIGLFALALRWLDWRAAALLAVAGLALGLFVLPRFGRGIYRDRDARWDLGIVSYPIAVLALILLFRHDLAVAASVWGMLAFGDPAAALAGRSLGGPRLSWNRDKTWSGLAANVGVSGAAGLFLFAFVAREAPSGWPVAVGVGVLVFALLESVRSGIEDNLVAPIPAALALSGILACGPDAWRGAWTGAAFLRELAVAGGVNLLVSWLTWRLGAVSAGGAVAGALIGTLILGLGGWGAYAVLWTFFLAATLATKLGYRAKAARGVAQKRGGRRGAEHAVANCGVAAGVLVVAAGFRPFYPDVVLAGFAGAFAAALADTLATEVGGLYGRRTVSLIDFRALPVGTPGAVSLPGFLAGLGGAGLVALVAFASGLLRSPLPWAVAAAGFLGSLAESAATDLTRRAGRTLDHEFANAFNTFVGAMAGMALALWASRAPLFLPIER